MRHAARTMTLGMVGRKMLSAITADLPGYLVPPRGRPDDGPPAAESRFGPAARLDVTTISGASDSKNSDSGVYGPNGQFVERGARRDLGADVSSGRPPHAGDGAFGPVNLTAPAPEEGTTGDRPHPLNTDAANRADLRDLSLTEFDVAVPPAARAELLDLASRINRRNGDGSLSADDYVRIADLMERIGHFDQAQRARDRADSLRNGGESASLNTGASESGGSSNTEGDE